MFTRRTKFIIYFYMCVRVIVSCNNQIFFPPSLFGQVCIFASKIRNWWPPWSEIRSALGWKMKDNAKYTKSGFPRHYRIINRRKKKLKRTIGGRCIAHVWIVDSSVQRLHSALFANMFTLTTSAVLRNLPVYKIMITLSWIIWRWTI